MFDWNKLPLLQTLAKEDTNSRSLQRLLKKELTVFWSNCRAGCLLDRGRFLEIVGFMLVDKRRLLEWAVS